MTLLDVDKLKKRYVSDNGDSFVALDIARFSMASGEQVGLRGSSGSGKTTFLNLLKLNKWIMMGSASAASAYRNSGWRRLIGGRI